MLHDNSEVAHDTDPMAWKANWGWRCWSSVLAAPSYCDVAAVIVGRVLPVRTAKGSAAQLSGFTRHSSRERTFKPGHRLPRPRGPVA